jgi:agmatinase
MHRDPMPAFLGSEIGKSDPAVSLFHVIPVPYEKTVSYGLGTNRGPAAILEASWYLEAFDGAAIPAEKGIYTCDPVDCRGGPEEVLSGIEKSTGALFRTGRIPVMLGGEHTVTLGAARALRHAGEKGGMIQLDAHADLRDSFEGTPYSHACVMRRVHELGIPLIQIGVRSLSLEEHRFRKSSGITHHDAAGLIPNGLPARWLPEDFPENVYVTIDIDALDPSLMPATGTPEPGGLSWYMTLDILRSIARQRRVVGFDLVELAPIPGLHACEYTAAKLIYAFMGMIQGRPAGA